MEDTFLAYFNSTGQSFTNSLANTALIFQSTDDEGASTLDPGGGAVTLFVGDPVQSWGNTTDFTVCFPLSINDECSAGETVPEAREIRDLLKPLKERLWQPREIRSRIEAYYVKQGFIPTVMLSDAAAPKRYINVQKSPRIGRILLPGDATQLTIAKLFYAVLTEKEFRYFLKHQDNLRPSTLELPGAKPSDPPQKINVQSIDYLDLGDSRTLGAEPFLNQFRLQSEQLQLGQLEYVITQMSAGGPRRGNAQTSPTST